MTKRPHDWEKRVLKDSIESLNESDSLVIFSAELVSAENPLSKYRCRRCGYTVDTDQIGRYKGPDCDEEVIRRVLHV